MPKKRARKGAKKTAAVASEAVEPVTTTSTVEEVPDSPKASTSKRKVPSSKDSSEPKAKKAATEEATEASGTKRDSTWTPCSDKWNLKISSWNINGIRAWSEKKGYNFLTSEKPDVLMVQEIKASGDQIPSEAKVKGYNYYFESSVDKKGYAGVGLYSKEKPISVSFGMGIEEHDNEGRLVTAEYEKFYLIGAYVPNSGRGLVRLGYRQKWNKDFLKFIKNLDAKKPIIYTGDLNVAHQEIDLTNPKTNSKTAGFTKEERADFTTLLDKGDFIDTYRELYPDERGVYSFWTYMNSARTKNIGWRLDYFVLSRRIKENAVDVLVHGDVMGSDHCPISLLLDI